MLIHGPDPIFSKSSPKIDDIDADILSLCDQLENLLYRENAIGVAAPMIGILKQVIAVNFKTEGKNNLTFMINPEIVQTSEDKQVFEEASICFPGISAKITRPAKIKVTYLNRHGEKKSLDAEGWFATVIQHEIDYLMGKTFLDYLSPLKRKMLLKKATKLKQKMV